ncbi:MAG: tRNA pseudouridine(38-40) synthase TruA [Alphaproteobacteria bacterium]|nr:tRNA pseudouridine(38-40) synthase TruA [Alphaproteobacteria bacterium]
MPQHARGQVAHFDLEKEMSADAVQGAINYYVKPHRIVIVAAEEVPETFHARFSALSRSYRYELVNRSAPLALRATQAWHVSRPLDIRPMQEAAQLLIGHHDFSTFRAQNCQARSPMRTLDQLDIARDGETITFTTRSRSYLYHQVRNMVGTLVWVGSDRWSVKDFAEAFAAADRAKGGPTAPAHGLLFLKVEYPPV